MRSSAGRWSRPAWRARTTRRAARPSWRSASPCSTGVDRGGMTMLHRVAVVFLAMFVVGVASAQSNFPSKPITMVVGFEPGGGTDTVARIVAKFMADNVGQQVLVENRAGAGGNIAVDYVNKAAPDGYTIVLANVGALTVNPHIMKLNYDPLHDLAPITMAVVFPNVIVDHPRVPAKNLADFVRLAKEQPGKITYGSSGV